MQKSVTLLAQAPSINKRTSVNTKLLSLLCGLGFALTSCVNPQKTESALLTGKVTVNWSNTIKLSSGAVTLTDSWIDRLSPGDSIIELNPDGTFRIEIPLEKEDFLRLSHESNEVEYFLSPGDSLHIDLSSEEIFSGDKEALNKHLRALRDRINANRRYINGLDFFGRSPAGVDAILDSLKTVYVEAHALFKEVYPVPERFENKIMADIAFRNKLYKAVHPPLYHQQTGEVLPVASTYYEDLGAGCFDDPALLKSLDYVLFVDAYLNAQAAGDLKFGNYFDAALEKIHPRYDQIAQLEAHQEIKDYLFREHLNQSMDNYGVAYLEDLLPRFREDCKDAASIEQIEARFQEGIARRNEPSTIQVYKRIGDIELEAHIFYPEDFQVGDQRPAYLFFHGGGWEIGVPEWGYKNCQRYSAKGMVAISFEYRLINVHGSDILDCVRDAKSAILWTRKQAESLGIDPDKIVAAGFSAGGHLAACTAILNEFEEADNADLGSKPDALVVHSASYNTLKNNWFARHSEQRPESISTFHQVDKGLVPSIFFHGTEDHLAPISEFTEFRDKMDSLGNDYEYKIFEGVGHFFNDPAARETVDELTEAFLVNLGYIGT